ncbi:MAG TPA: FAD-dependent oxidoreductase [Phycisphaerae bacterium]|nr:FAD-dependent oxidoreductase [Phycisphaerae bacterium]HUT61989.1 FAD-dependent oxidoreductase [Phycisphaerae bacterium]
MNEACDVIVIGGGSAGIVAAIQAGRAGAKTLLVEKYGILGGTTTMAHVNFPGIFFAWGRQVVAGIGWELVEATLSEADEPLPDMNQPKHWQRHVRVNMALFAALSDRALCDAGVELRLHTMIAAAARAEDGWTVTLCTKTGLTDVHCKVLIDGTGDANAVQLAGLKVNRHQPMQPGSILFTVGGYDPDRLDLDALDRAWSGAVAEGRFRESDLGWGKQRLRRFLRGGGGNCTHVCGIDGATSEGKTAADLAGRDLMLRLFRFLKAQRGLEGLKITSLAPECGIRETVTIRGKATISSQDYTSGRVWPDAVCYSFYPIDVHTADGDGVDFRPLADGVVATIPRGAMLPADSRFLIAAGRHIAGDRLAHSAYRTQATCMATGQAAGAMAALSAQSGIDPEELDIERVRALLCEHGAIVPEMGSPT